MKKLRLHSSEGGADLGESITLDLFDDNGHLSQIGNIFNAVDYPCADESKTEDIDMQARVFSILFVNTPLMLKAIKLSYYYTNIGHTLSPSARAEAAQKAFDACEAVLANIQRSYPTANTEAVFKSLGWDDLIGQI